MIFAAINHLSYSTSDTKFQVDTLSSLGVMSCYVRPKNVSINRKINRFSGQQLKVSAYTNETLPILWIQYFYSCLFLVRSIHFLAVIG